MVNDLKIKNFGPIKSADFSIAPLTIFVGPNASGKSYATLLMHSLLNPFNRNIDSQLNSVKSLEYLLDGDGDLFNEFNENFINYLGSDFDFSEMSFEFPSDKFNRLLELGVGRFYTESVENKLKSNFDSSLDNLNNVVLNDSFNLEFNGIHFRNENNHLVVDGLLDAIGEIKIENENLILGVSRKNGNVVITLNPIALHLNTIKNEYIPSIIYGIISEVLIYNLISNSYYIPASSYAISNDLNDNLSKQINGDFKASKIDKELMSLLLNNKSSGEGFFKSIAVKMSVEIFGGILDFKDVDEGIKFIDTQNNVEFDFNSVSSSIKELAPFIKYLSDLSRENDTVIIEEPENHLHPKNQRILVKYLVELINRGLNIILNTHSDYILEQFNNFIRLGGVDEDKLNQLNYSTKHVLDHEDIRIYNFKKESDYLFEADLVDVNETGFVDENFSKITDELYDESVDIIDSMKR
ncbi:MAG: AAA family ATPase [Methanobrevibacter sp.]|uniref:AAA family ATPase n=1 Tax=Methanobrevibacter sp. TaxID=66852 RepID=UPI0025D0A6DF|nr:AAA family ATPase [Methanobrevibacter sp.]MBQ8017763.1 AAA family ATPase [Methanobrevibacter sp.]